MKQLVPLLLAVVVLLSGGCKPKEITALQRKQAANLVSEAQFAVALRDYARAEPLYVGATKLCPDIGDYWVNLGVTRRRLGNKAGAKAAYQSGLDVYRDAFDRDAQNTDAVLQEVYVLALLGRADDARKTLEKAQKKLPENRALRAFVESHQLDQILGDATYKELAL